MSKLSGWGMASSIRGDEATTEALADRPYPDKRSFVLWIATLHNETSE